MLRKGLVRALKAAQLDGFIKACLFGAGRLRRIVTRTDGRIIRDYFTAHKIRKLHIGSGRNSLSGWLNADLSPSPVQLYLDARKRFPFPDATFDLVFSEHMIEHITYAQGLHMLSECYRVLKPDGTIRVATPDLSFFVRLYREEKDELEYAYIKWMTDTFIPTATSYRDTFVINNSVRYWGHQFIYDEKVLCEALTRVGFVDVRRCELQQSGDPELCGLEHEQRMPEGLLRLETFVLEATKPGSQQAAAGFPNAHAMSPATARKD